MEKREWGLFPAVLRRALSIIEFVVAGLLLFSGIVFSIDTPGRRTGDGIGDKILEAMALPLILYGLGIVVAAVTAWIGGRRWWIWQVAILTLEVGLPIATIIVLVIIDIIFIN